MKNKKSIFALFLAIIMLLTAFAMPVGASQVSLVPAQPGKSANYVCTWEAQLHDRDILNHETLFGENGWASSQALYPMDASVRADVFFLLDDGWDLPPTSNPNWRDYYSSFLLSEEKFPGYGDTPQERLKTMADHITANGWRGLGVWVAMDEHPIEYWREKLEWSKYAGIGYWKIDWGNVCDSDAFRRQLNRVAKEVYPELIMEHVRVTSPVNGYGGATRHAPSVYRDWAYTLSYSDVYRIYDVLEELTTATTLDRVAGLLQHAYSRNTNGPAMNLINGEDALYLNAALGLTSGVMRYGIVWGGGRMAEVSRMLRWQRIAPAYRADAYPVNISTEYLEDSHYIGWHWHGPSRNTVVRQSAPAAIGRGIAMPAVTVTEGEKPFVVASRNPNGAISIAALGRTYDDAYHANHTAQVSLNAGDLTGKIGVFGVYESLALTFNQNLEGKMILAQDLNADAPIDITSRVAISGKTITLPGALISEIGRLQNPAGDPSEPGLVLQIGDPDDFLLAPPTRVVRQPLSARFRGAELFRNPSTAQWMDAGMWQGGWPKRISYYALFCLLWPGVKAAHVVMDLFDCFQ